MSLNKFWGHYIDGQAIIQESLTALIIKPDMGYVLKSTPLSKLIGFQEGSFLRHPQAQGALSGDAGWVTNGFLGAQLHFFVVPSFVFKLTFWAVLLRSFAQSVTRWSGLPHPKQFPFFLWYNLTMMAKTKNIPNWLICSFNSSWGFCMFSSWRLSLFFPFWVHSLVFFSFIAFHCSRFSSEGTIVLQLPGGKQVPWGLTARFVWSYSCSGLQE